jgi:hypothetical protein
MALPPAAWGPCLDGRSRSHGCERPIFARKNYLLGWKVPKRAPMRRGQPSFELSVARAGMGVNGGKGLGFGVGVVIAEPRARAPALRPGCRMLSHTAQTCSVGISSARVIDRGTVEERAVSRCSLLISCHILFDRARLGPVEYWFGSHPNIFLGQSRTNEGHREAWRIIFRR